MSIVLANLGAAYGTAKSGVGIANLGVMRPDMVMRSIIPVVMAGVLGIYGLITAVIINGKIHPPSYSAYSGYAHLAAGITVGMSSLAAGMAIGVVGDAGVRANAQQPRLFVGMILILIFAEALGLYGLIVGSQASGKNSSTECVALLHFTVDAMQVCDPSSAFFGFMGVTSALVFANLGAAYGTAKSGVGIASMGVMRPDMIMKSIIPVVMAGVLGIYGLITAVIINGKMDAANYSAYSGYAHLGAGLTVGMSSLAAGLAIGIVGDAGVRANAQQPRLFVGMILILIFAEALGLYGLIVGLVVASTAEGKGKGLCKPYA
eukprot:CAMPEP_0181476236 /NCGR_PEP_ID=MMETSP1110-20121109/41604_1 /TAXON_ID=174948 /ORGANISM="Symbiodinium sp., Strain CCMP421" /LENGTH=318 /DNA_ID=CAMNT_0023601515 /DNA_START=76 /DNA_END=1032 /DNA_ORIENTATION=+